MYETSYYGTCVTLLGAGDERGGRLTSTKGIHSCLLITVQEKPVTCLLLHALEALCQAGETAVSWACLLAKLVGDEE